jgi:acetylglutamate kinase
MCTHDALDTRINVLFEALPYINKFRGATIVIKYGGHAMVIPSIHCDQVENMVADKTLTGGMIPKVRACVSAMDRGVGKTHIIDGRVPHALLHEIFSNSGIGTQITKD